MPTGTIYAHDSRTDRLYYKADADVFYMFDESVEYSTDDLGDLSLDQRKLVRMLSFGETHTTSVCFLSPRLLCLTDGFLLPASLETVTTRLRAICDQLDYVNPDEFMNMSRNDEADGTQPIFMVRMDEQGRHGRYEYIIEPMVPNEFMRPLAERLPLSPMLGKEAFALHHRIREQTTILRVVYGPDTKPDTLWQAHFAVMHHINNQPGRRVSLTNPSDPTWETML